MTEPKTTNDLNSTDAAPSRSQAIADLFQRYRPALYAYFLRRTRHPTDAEDLVQEVFIRLSRMDPSVHLHDTEGFLFKVGVNLLRDRARRERARFAVFEPARADFIAVATEPDAERVLQAKAEIREVMIWLNSLSERTRNIFVLRRFEQMKCEQIAGLYGISINAVEQHIRKALASLAKSRMKSHD